MQNNKKPVRYIMILVVALVILFVIQPVITSYFVLGKQKQDVKKEDNTKEEIFRLNAEVNSLEDKYQECIKDKDSYKIKMEEYLDKSNVCEGKLGNAEGMSFSCKKELDSIKRKFEDSEGELEDVKKNLEDVKKELSDCKKGIDEEYDKLAKSSADTLCCLQRFYDSDIDSYDVKDNKIICIKGGKNKISC